MLISLLFESPIAFLLVAVALIISVTIHEFAHAIVADKLGDPTPRSQGRVTINPLSHLDPVGTIMIVLAGFGWGKPVMYDPYNFKQPVRDSALISLAGPTSNLLLAGAMSILINNGIFHPVMLAVLYINVMLAVFNLIPVFPLDGGKVLVALLPKSIAYEYESFMNRYGQFVLLALIFPWGDQSPASRLISPVISFIVDFLL